jgi:hypothetical protein
VRRGSAAPAARSPAVFRDGAALDTSPTSQYDDLSALPGSSYDYEVDAYDGAGNHSGVSTTLNVDVPAAGGASTVMAAGDIACDPTDGFFNGGAGTARHCRARATSDLLVNGSPDAVLSLGDQQYVCGGYQAFNQSFDSSWGRVLRPRLWRSVPPKMRR